jgi:hypothetical protein
MGVQLSGVLVALSCLLCFGERVAVPHQRTLYVGFPERSVGEEEFGDGQQILTNANPLTSSGGERSRFRHSFAQLAVKLYIHFNFVRSRIVNIVQSSISFGYVDNFCNVTTDDRTRHRNHRGSRKLSSSQKILCSSSRTSPRTCGSRHNFYSFEVV